MELAVFGEGESARAFISVSGDLDDEGIVASKRTRELLDE